VPDIESEPLVRAAHRVAAQLLTPQAAAVDASQVPRSHLTALGEAGLLGMAAPACAAGTEAARPVARRVNEILAGADLATWFVQAQHHGPVRSLVAAGGFEDVVRRLAVGDLIAGSAFSQLRRWPDRPLTAIREGGGWRFDGNAPWYTGWGINDVLLVSGVDPDGVVVHALVDAVAGPGLVASEPIRLAAVQAAVTVTLQLRGLRVPAERIVSTQAVADWAASDDLVTVNVNPAVFGVTASAVELLAAQGERRGEPEAVDAASWLGARLAGLRSQAYALLDEVPPAEQTELRLALRARSHRLMVEATTALVIAGAGGAVAAGSAAARKAREALFLLVQAQTAAGRRSALKTWGR
jgi:alkylation response protein AidB-like acyl-CoA dehydrogenase